MNRLLSALAALWIINSLLANDLSSRELAKLINNGQHKDALRILKQSPKGHETLLIHLFFDNDRPDEAFPFMRDKFQGNEFEFDKEHLKLLEKMVSRARPQSSLSFLNRLEKQIGHKPIELAALHAKLQHKMGNRTALLSLAKALQKKTTPSEQLAGYLYEEIVRPKFREQTKQACLEAVQVFDQVFKTAPSLRQNPRMLFQYAATFKGAREYRKSIAILDQIRSEHPDHYADPARETWIANQYADNYFALGDYETALRYYQRVETLSSQGLPMARQLAATNEAKITEVKRRLSRNPD